MQEETRYRVVLSGRMLPGRDRDQVIDALAKLFGSSREKMARLVQGREVPFKKAYDREEAIRIRDQVRAAGAECEVEPILASAEETLAEPPAAAAVEAARPEQEPGREPPSRPVPGSETGAAAAQQAPGSMMVALMAYVGPRADYYRRRFERFGDPRQPRFVLTWHWPAFFAFSLWALYRKMWKWAGINFAGSILLFYLFAPLPLLLGWVMAWPLAANWLYFRQAREKVLAIGTDPASQPRLAAEGGVNSHAVLLGIGLVLILNTLFSQFFLNRLLSRFEQEYGQLLPESGTMLRGDGSVLDTAEADAKTRATVRIISMLAVSIRIWMSGQEKQGEMIDFNRLLRELGREKFIDGWGNPIRIRQDAQGVIINSAGPDGEFDNTDDILHTVPLDRLDTRSPAASTNRS